MGTDVPTRSCVPLDELTEEETPITHGVVKSSDEGNAPFVRGGDIEGGRILQGRLRTITQEVSRQYRRTLLCGGEIHISLVGSLTTFRYAEDEFPFQEGEFGVDLRHLRSVMGILADGLTRLSKVKGGAQ